MSPFLPSLPLLPIFLLVAPLPTSRCLCAPLGAPSCPFSLRYPPLRPFPLTAPGWSTPEYPLSKPGRPACPANGSRCAQRAALHDLSPGPRAGSGGQGRDVTAGRGRGSGRAGGSRGRCFPALKRQKAEPGPASEWRARGSELGGRVAARIRAAGHGLPGAAHTSAPCGESPAADRPATRAHTPHVTSPWRAALSPARRVSAKERSDSGAGPELLAAPAPAPPPAARRCRHRRVDAKYQLSSPFQVSTRPSGRSLRERRNFAARAGRRRHHEGGRGR